mgnify:FL=1
MNDLCEQYYDILEETHNIPMKHNEDNDLLYMTNTKLYNHIHDFIINNNIKRLIVSLSGGVDSMVMLEILLYIQQHTIHDLYFVCCHLNYNNRLESIKERDFLNIYCQLKNVPFCFRNLNYKRRHYTKRAVYEKMTRDFRYTYYRELCDENNSSGVFLAHHKDDICENIFNNIMRGGHEITDLVVIKEKNVIMDVNVYRPMLPVYKNHVYDIAHTLNIPYFLDTTPDWSCRGKMRRNIFPQCDDCYTNTYKDAMLKLGRDSEDINNILHKYLLNDYIASINIIEKSFVLPNKPIICETYMMKLILKHICHSINIPVMKSSNVTLLTKYIAQSHVGKIKVSLLKHYTITVAEMDVCFDYNSS